MNSGDGTTRCLRTQVRVDWTCVDTMECEMGLVCRSKSGGGFGARCKLRNPHEPCGGPSRRKCEHGLFCTNWSPLKTGVCRRGLLRGARFRVGIGRKCRHRRCVAAAAGMQRRCYRRNAKVGERCLATIECESGLRCVKVNSYLKQCEKRETLPSLKAD